MKLVSSIHNKMITASQETNGRFPKLGMCRILNPIDNIKQFFYFRIKDTSQNFDN